jgi:hypothetical protein
MYVMYVQVKPGVDSYNQLLDGCARVSLRVYALCTLP